MAYYFSFQVGESSVTMADVASSSSSSSSDSDDDVGDGLSLDFSYQGLSELPSKWEVGEPASVRSLNLENNNLVFLPRDITQYSGLTYLDVSGNCMHSLPANLGDLRHLQTLLAKHNQLEDDGLPKDLSGLQALRVVNLSGNCLTEFPAQLIDLVMLKAIYLGSNQIASLPHSIGNLTSLEILYLGGNHLEEIPHTIALMEELTALILSDNRLLAIPCAISHLARLRSLSLHNNRLATLPQSIIKLSLVELTLRGNPLVVRFVRDLTYDPPTLRELSARVVKVKRLTYRRGDIPDDLMRYLASGKSCVNPKCKGVYFASHVENVNFVDFCGKYRIPLLEYLCTPSCSEEAAYAATSSSAESDDDTTVPVSKMKRVLLG